MRVTFNSGPLTLEGDLIAPANRTGGAVICHPHPQYGGDMHNPVVGAIADGAQRAGRATLRFNFRGVGASGGSYGGGVGEQEDARAAVRYLMEQAGVSRVALAGYSFGAMVALQAGAQMAEVDQLIAIAPPLSFFDLGFLATCEKPKLFIVGDRDQYCSVPQLTRELARVAQPVTHHILAGADHFFAGRETVIADAVRSFVGK